MKKAIKKPSKTELEKLIATSKETAILEFECELYNFFSHSIMESVNKIGDRLIKKYKS